MLAAYNTLLLDAKEVNFTKALIYESYVDMSKLSVLEN